MMMGFSKHRFDGDGGSVGRGVTDYFFAETVTKKTPSGSILLHRHPVPEILVGDPKLFRATVRSLTFQNKYRSGVLSFAARDVSVSAFNSGDPGERAKVAAILSLLIEIIFPGIPRSARPTFLAGTHTHADRFELNFAVPQCVLRDDGRLRALNPDPPGRARQLWLAFRDLVNVRFGFADPDDPARRQLVVGKNWRTKTAAEAARAGMIDFDDGMEAYLEALRVAIMEGEVETRNDVLGWLETAGAEAGWTVLRTDAETITVGAPGSLAKDRTRLRGLACRKDFDGRAFSDSDARREAEQKRAFVLQTAPTRLREEWKRVAAFNRSRFGRGAWPATEFDPQMWLAGQLDPALGFILSCHFLITTSETQNHDGDLKNDSRSIQPDGAKTLGYRAPDAAGRAGASETNISAGTDGNGPVGPDRGAGGDDAADGGYLGAVILARRFELIAAAVRQAIAWAHRRIASVLALQVASRSVSETVLEALKTLRETLENNHDGKPYHAAGDRAAIDRDPRGARDPDARAHPADHAPQRGGWWGGGAEVGTIDRGNGRSRRWPDGDGTGPEEPPRSPRGLAGSPRTPREYRSDVEDPRRNDRGDGAPDGRMAQVDVGGRLNPPEGSRAERLVKIRSALQRALPQTRVTVRPRGGRLQVVLEGTTEIEVSSDRLHVLRGRDHDLMGRAVAAIRSALGWSAPTRGPAKRKPVVSPRSDKSPRRFVFVDGGGENFLALVKAASGLDGGATTWHDLSALNDLAICYDVKFLARAGHPLEALLVTSAEDPNSIDPVMMQRWCDLVDTAKDKSSFQILRTDRDGVLQQADFPELTLRHERDELSDDRGGGPQDPLPDF